jgi:hypothetical protein
MHRIVPGYTDPAGAESVYGGTGGQGSASKPREYDFGTRGLGAVMVPEAVRRVERADDDGATCSELRADSSPGERLGEKYCDSQSGGHEDDSRSDFGVSLDSEVNEVRRRSLAIMARIAARFFSPSSSDWDCVADNSLRSTGSPKSKPAHPSRDKLMIIQTNHLRHQLNENNTASRLVRTVRRNSPSFARVDIPIS